MRLWYRQPAAQWVEALPQGNGRLGTMTFGGIEKERIALNEDTLWSGYPHSTILPDSYEHVKRAQELVLQGQAKEAEQEICRHVLGEFSESYQPLGDLLLTFPGVKEEAARGYQRELYLTTGVSSVQFQAGNTAYTRTLFVSHPRQMICLRMTASQPVLALNVTMQSLLRHQVRAEGHTLVLSTRCPSRALPGYYDRSAEAIVYEDAPEKQGISATTVLNAATDGTITAAGETLTVADASWVELRLACRSNFESFRQFPGLSRVDHAALARKDVQDAESIPFDQLKAEHSRDFSAYMNRQTIEVEGTSLDGLPTDERLRRYTKGGTDDALPLLLYQFGRYLLVSASRPGTQATNLQGIWNDMLQPPWSSNYTTNINTEMNYWPSEICHLSETHEPLFDLMDRLSVTGAQAAQALFRARGAMTCHNTDLWGLATPVGMFHPGAAVYGWWLLAYAWLVQHVFEHYIYTGDTAFLRERALPLIRNAAQFLIDSVTEDAQGYVSLRPATSPENRYLLNGDRLSVAADTAMTNAIIQEVLENYLTALERLNIQEEDAQAARHILKHLPPRRIGRDGRLLEWDAEYEEVEPQHRHISLLYGLFPGHLMDRNSDQSILNAIRAVLAARGDDGTGWSLGWKVNIWARLQDGDHALSLLRKQLRLVDTSGTNYGKGGGSYLNLFCAHPPFQIDGNFAAASGVPRLLIDSALDEIVLLPARPSTWKNLTARGLRGANGYTVDLTVRDGQLTELRLVSGSETPTRICLGPKTMTLCLAAGEEIRNPRELMG